MVSLHQGADVSIEIPEPGWMRPMRVLQRIQSRCLDSVYGWFDSHGKHL